MTSAEYDFAPDPPTAASPAATVVPELLDAIFQTSPDGLLLLVVQDSLGQIVHCNARAIQLFRAQTREELLQHLNTQFHTQSQQMLLTDAEVVFLGSLLQQAHGSERHLPEPWQIERAYPTLQGGQFWAKLTPHLVSCRGKPFFLIRITDISEHKQRQNLQQEQQVQPWQTVHPGLNSSADGTARQPTVQEQLNALCLENAQLKRATQMKDEFLASMSHELRTPLNAILGISEGILESPEALNPNQRSLVQSIETSGRHLLKLINDVLEIAKIESGTVNLELEPTSVVELCEFSLLCVRPAAERKNLQIVTNIPDDLGWIQVDIRRMQQVLINLLNNAVKFTDHGSVSLSVHLDRQQRQISFQIQDTGIGIAPDHQQHLFEAFVQVESSLTRRQQGTGLGLALVKNTVTLMGGNVSVESRLGQGSCFTVCLPWQSAPSSSAASQSANPLTPDEIALDSATSSSPAVLPQATDSPATANSPQVPQILLVEDDDINLQTFSNYFRQRGYQMLIARNGREGVDLAQLHTPQLILMDIHMPEMDGLSAMRLIRADPKLAQTPIIALTAMAMMGDREVCLAAGATEYCSKPVRLRQLAEMIQSLLNPSPTTRTGVISP